MKKNILRIILIVCILFWMYTVFGFSKHTGEVSSGISTKIAKLFSNDEDVIITLEKIIRKIAHLSEYAVGGILFYSLFLTFKMSAKKQVIFSILITTIYAITDEIHQLFVPGRSGKITDVGIDVIGISIGICGLLFIIKIIQKIKNKAV